MATQDIDTPSSLPPYPQMIMAALDALNEPMGSNKTSISKFIESKYPNLPAGHTTLLKHHLNRMKESEQVIFWKNNYMKPRPDFIRRGRGRPPKSKDSGMASPPAGSPKPRGRPRKDEMDSTDPSGESVEVKKKKVSPDNGEQPTKTGRGRGRPPKAKAQAPTAMGGEEVSAHA